MKLGRLEIRIVGKSNAIAVSDSGKKYGSRKGQKWTKHPWTKVDIKLMKKLKKQHQGS